MDRLHRTFVRVEGLPWRLEVGSQDPKYYTLKGLWYKPKPYYVLGSRPVKGGPGT